MTKIAATEKGPMTERGPIRLYARTVLGVAVLLGCEALVGRAGAAETNPAAPPGFNPAAVEVWNGAALAQPPKVHPAEQRPAKGMRSLFYEGADYKGQPTWIFAYYATPGGEPPEGGWPAVVCAHGGGGTAYPAWIRKWNSHGYAAIAMDLEGHLPSGNSHGVRGNFPARQKHKNSGPARIDYFGDRDLPDNEQWFYHAVAGVIRANSLLRSFPEINPRKIGLTGISWGGTVVSAAAGVDSRFAFVIPVYGAGFIHKSDNPGLAQWFPPKNMTEQQFHDYRTKWDPAAHLPYAKMPMLFVTSVADPVFQIDIFSKSALAAGGSSRLSLRPWMIHGHGNGWNDPQEIYDFADSIVKDGPPLPELGTPKVHPETGRVHVPYNDHSGRGITGAWVYHTSSGGLWKDRKWHFIDCDVRGDEAVSRARLPSGTRAYLVYGFRQQGNQRINHISSEVMVLKP